MKLFLRGFAVLGSLALGACAHSTAYEPLDPLEPVNRPIYKFNRTADRYVLRPVAKGYATVVPWPVRTGVRNFFDNLFYPTTIVSDLLQGKFTQGGKDLGRFALNSTVGLAGLVDVATPNGLPQNDEDLGQTFGKWGVGQGWYLMLPLLGPSTNRDLVGRIGDNWTEPLQYIDDVDFWDRVILTGVNVTDKRSRLLDDDKILDQQLDEYVFVRDAYLQHREALVYDGNPPAPEFDIPED